MKEQNNLQSNLLNHKSFFSYLINHLSKLPLIIRFKEIYIFLRKYIFIGRVLRIAKSIMMFLQTGAFLILYASAALIVIPLIIIILLVIFIIRFKKHKRYNKFFGGLIKTNTFSVVFIDDDELSLDRSSAENTQHITLFVSENPTYLIPGGLKKINSKSFLISTGYFYSLKKHIIDKNKGRIYYKNEEEL